MKMLKLAKKYYFIAALVLVFAGFVFWRQAANRPVYDEFTAETMDITETMELSGEVSAANSAVLRFGAGGLVTYMGAKEGDWVNKWQTVASLDTRQLQKVLTQKLNLYAIERGEFDQGQDDHEDRIQDGDIDKELRRLLEKNQYQLNNTVLDVEYQDLSLRLSRIYSPIRGILVHSPITVANVQVGPTDSWQIVDPSTLEFIADLDETDLDEVTMGQKVVITLDAYPDREIESTVASISFAPVETTTGTTYRLKVPVPVAYQKDLRLGLNGTAAVIMEEKEDVTVLRSSAIRLENGVSTVTVLRDGKYLDQEIKTGIESDGYVEIVSGLGAGDHVYIQAD